MFFVKELSIVRHKMKLEPTFFQAVEEQSGEAPASEEAPAEEAPVEPETAAETKAAPAAASDDPATAFPGERRVSMVEQTCCGGFAQKSKICAIQ